MGTGRDAGGEGMSEMPFGMRSFVVRFAANSVMSCNACSAAALVSCAEPSLTSTVFVKVEKVKETAYSSTDGERERDRDRDRDRETSTTHTGSYYCTSI